MLRIFLALWFAIMPAFAWAGSMTLMGVGAGGSATWTPAQLSGLIAWYRADIGVFTDTGCTTAATNTQTVACWKDQSGNGNDFKQATALNQPEFLSAGYDGKQTISCTAASSQFMTTAVGVGIGANTTGSAFAVGQMLSGTASNGRLVTYAKATGSADFQSGGWVALSRNVTGSSLQTLRSGGATSPASGSISLATNMHFGMVLDGTNGNWYINNVLSGTPSALAVATTTGGYLGLCHQLNAAGADGATYWSGPVSEIVVTNQALSSTDRANLETWFSRW